jgi:bifunctional UDP-N-acetylglucosamine pyrophosphorylase / glucosamine-1-phosphate N-acetyltransferase
MKFSVTDELRLVRAEQLVKPGWADRFHEAMKRK